MILNPYPCTSLEAAALYIEAHPERPVGLTSGTFDLFHDFHERFLERCRRSLGPNCILIVGVDSDAEVRRAKGKGRPFQSEYQRRMLMDSNKNVTFVYIQDGVADFERMCETLLTIRGGTVFRNEVFEGREDEVALGEAREHPDVNVMIIPDITELASTTELTDSIRREGV
jgi:cytidyltransferase-like protein